MHDTFVARLPKQKIQYLLSTAVHYIDLATGKSDAILEVTRKNNLEMAAAYGLIKESGGVMVTIDGTSWKDKKYLKYGQDKWIPVIVASTKKLAEELVKQLNKN